MKLYKSSFIFSFFKKFITMKLSSNLNLAIRIFVGLAFVFSAISKLISIDSFEIYIYSFGLLKLNVTFFFARFIISLELFLGILLLVGKYCKKVVIVSVAMLSVFSAFILFLVLTRNNESCHCFGEIKMSHTASILKNIFFITLLLFAYQSKGSNFKHDKLIVLAALICSIFLPLTFAPPDSLFYSSYAKNVTYNELMFQEYLKVNSEYSKGKVMLCFFSTGCRFCKLAARKVSTIAKKANGNQLVNFLFTGSEGSITTFFQETNSHIFPYCFIQPNRFLKITNGEMPLILLLENGKIKGKYGYRDLNEMEIIRFLSN